MAVTNVLAAGLTAASSSDITVTATPVTVSLMTVAGGALPSGVVCTITKLNSSAQHQQTGYVLATGANSVTGETQSMRALTSPGVYRVARPLLTGVTDVAVGVDQDA
jgi:hypothetical protein